MIKLLIYLFCIVIVSCTSNNIIKPEILSSKESLYENQIDLLGQELLSQLNLQKNIKLAVLDFVMLDGGNTAFCKLVADDLTNKLHSSDKVELIERNMIYKVFEEYKFNFSGFVDESTIKKIGNISGVDAIVTGSIANFKKRVRISARIIATDTGKVLSASAVNILIGEEIKDLLKTEQSNKLTSHKQYIKEVDGFQIKLIKSKQIESNVNILLDVTNISNNTQECIIGYGNPYTKIFDKEGNEYVLSEVQIGNIKKKFHKGGSGYQIFTKEVPVNIPTQVMLTFSGVSNELNEIYLLNINFGKTKRLINFYNIPIEP